MGDIDLSVRVLTKVYWPTNQVPMCKLPLSAELALREFERFYLGKHNGRKISLNPCLGNADVRAIFYGRPTTSGGADEQISQLVCFLILT